MYILAKKVETGGVTIHGLTDDDGEMGAWQAAGQIVFEISPSDLATFDPYQPYE